jgi:hypothetical protein
VALAASLEFGATSSSEPAASARATATAEPAPTKPAPAKPAATKTATAEPATTESATTEPATTKSATAAPDAVPEATLAATPEPTDPTPEQPAPEPTEDEPVAETVHRSAIEAETAHPEAEVPSGAAAVDAGDHDGQTIVVRDVAKLRGGRRGRAKAPAAPPPPPSLVLVVSTTGAREPLDQPILVGRSPSASKVSGVLLPRLLTVGGADQDISRTHVHFTVEGGTVVVTDLHSKNGTSVRLPGKEPQKLRAGEPTTVLVGTVVDLGGGLTFTVEEEPVPVAGKPT